MTSNWANGTVGDLVKEPPLELANEPWKHELITVRLHAKGLVPSGKNPNQTKSARKHYFRRVGEILVGRQNFHRQCVGVVPEELDGLVTSNAISSFVAREGINPRFALLVMQSKSIADTADQLMPGTGQREISVRTLMSIPVVLPPLAEQRRIVDLIGGLDEAIEAADQSANDSADLLLSLQSAAPDGPMVPFGTVLTDIDSGVSSKPSEDADGTLNIGILKVSAVRSALFQTHEIKRLGNLPMPEKARVREGDLLITRSNTPATVGQVCIARDVPSDSFLPDLIWRLNIDRKVVVPEFLEHYLSSSESRSAITSMATGTSLSMRKINKTNIKTLPISLPPLDAQIDYAERCDSSRIGLARSRENVQSLRALRSEILTSLLSGAHTIPESYDELLDTLDA